MRGAILVLLLCAATAHADPATKAHALNATGKKHLKAKDYVAALEAFEEAYDIYPSAGLLVNIGTTYQQMGKTVEAANWYQRYLDDPGAQEPLATQTQKSLAVLDINLGRLAITVEPGAEIQIGDGAWQAAAPLVRVQPGTFVVRARIDDAIAEQSGRVDAGAEVAVVLELQKQVEVIEPPSKKEPVVVEKPVVVEEEEEYEPPAKSHRKLYAYASGGAGVIALGGALWLALRANDLYGRAEVLCDYDTMCNGAGVTTDDRREATALADEGKTDRLIAIGLAVVGTAAVATGAVLWLKKPSGDSSAAITFVAQPDQIGLAAAGTF